MGKATVLENFSGFDWGGIAKKLTAFVIQYMNYCTGKKYTEWNFPEGYQADDIAYKAISDVITGVRTWNPEKNPDFLRFMQFSVCRSIISNLYSAANQQRSTPVDHSSFFDPDSQDGFELYSGNTINFGLHFEQELDNEIFLEKIGLELAEDNIAEMVLLSVLDGNENRHISSDLDITEAEVVNAKKRIKRAAERVLSILKIKRDEKIKQV